jgi:repressor of nif and glnA expression
MSYRDLVEADMRLVILQVLEEDPDYSHNERILQAALERVGHGISSDRLRTELRWVEEQGLVTIDDVGLFVVKLTHRGEDVALGRARVDGVARPRPR